VKDLNFSQPTTPPVLRKQWDAVTDELIFKVTIREKPSTRRGLQSIASSIHDPLGLVAPFVLPPKIVLQELCRDNLSWHDSITEGPFVHWNVWFGNVPKTDNFRVSRCIRQATLKEITLTLLNTFTDTSKRGYGTASFMRFADVNGKGDPSFMIAKSRVSPLKKRTVSRIQL